MMMKSVIDMVAIEMRMDMMKVVRVKMMLPDFALSYSCMSGQYHIPGYILPLPRSITMLTMLLTASMVLQATSKPLNGTLFAVRLCPPPPQPPPTHTHWHTIGYLVDYIAASQYHTSGYIVASSYPTVEYVLASHYYKPLAMLLLTISCSSNITHRVSL